MQRRERGNWGEDIAVRYLQGKGYRILSRQWRHGHKELDIVAMSGGVLVVVEVKTRSGNCWEEPADAVGQKKQRNMVAAAEAYVQEFNIDAEVRFDVVSVLAQGTKYVLEHIEDAFYPTL